MSKKLGLVCFSSQPRASRSTFKSEVFIETVAKPIQRLLDESVAHIRVVVMVNTRSPWAEITSMSIQNCRPIIAFSTPTLDALLKTFPEEIKSGRISLEVARALNTGDAEQRAIASLVEQKISPVVVKRISQPFPTPDEISVLHRLMVERGTTVEVLGQSRVCV